ncbi:MAG: hypothetical protein JSS78_02115 [Bacteroidetes bacterium]|nr:hypothetical protein [Bacteroidota bacterium]
MKMKIFVEVVILGLLTLGFSNKANAQWHGRYHHYGYYGPRPRVMIAVRPPVYCPPPPRYHRYRVYPRYRQFSYGEYCPRKHYRCRANACYDNGHINPRYSYNRDYNSQYENDYNRQNNSYNQPQPNNSNFGSDDAYDNGNSY